VLFAALAAGVAGPYMGQGSVCGADAAATAQAPEDAGAATTGEPCAGLAAANAEGNVRGVGMILFTDYVWPFEVTSVLLVIAALGAMVLGKHTESAADLVDEQVDQPVAAGAGATDTGPERPPITGGTA
jgi:NADH-quinone oxidoreductase subunit J